jgi:NAD-dependent dihydropyrimidine dehydrogenase PreA subunit
MLEIELDKERCTGCGLCVDFCPVEVFEMVSENGRKYPSPVHLEECWACDTCVGQCPTGALRVIEPQVSPGRQRVLALEGKGDGRLQVEERLPRE